MRALLRWMLLAACAVSGSSYADESKPGATPAVIELFTSQGCNSCPPADALLGEFAKRTGVIALAFHVDYWDSLGWHDRFAIPDALLRQRRYAETLPHGGVYTPQVIVDGQRSLLGTDKRGITTLVAANTNTVPLTLVVDKMDLKVVLEAQPNNVPCDVNLAAYVTTASTPVGRGENAGRTLKEFNIVRSFRRLGAWTGEPTTFAVALASLPSDADAVAVFVQRVDQGAVTGAARASLR